MTAFLADCGVLGAVSGDGSPAVGHEFCVVDAAGGA
jgi:hypothetical protein